MASSKGIYKAIKRLQESGDMEDFVNGVLRDELGWPVDFVADYGLDSIAFDWSKELSEIGLNSRDGPVELRQLRPFPNWPGIGVFFVRFGSSRVFERQKGMTLPLRSILRSLMPNQRASPSNPTWNCEQLIFVCRDDSAHFNFARFKDKGDGSKLPELRMFGWGQGDDLRTICDYNLLNLEYDEALSQEKAIKKIQSSFDIEAVSSSFYKDYKKQFNQAKLVIGDHSDLVEDELHKATQVLFNRMLFIRFIEKKGWITFAGSGEYLRKLYEAKGVGANSFFKSRLRRLFFEGLAIEGKQIDTAYGEVPFLNGGLFEEGKLDKQVTELPDSLFDGLIGEHGLFYRYNFTVQESTPLDVDVAIDPEMIGTMFEELVTGRNDKGAFYTPRVVVAYMCNEAIKSFLRQRTEVGTHEIHRLVMNSDVEGISIDDAREINEALFELKAIDPACGSGAYLLGLLHELIRIHELLSSTVEELSETRHDMKLRVISRSIYGVDIDPYATNIAMLRLWLSLSVDAPSPMPLPNLDFNIETGDSLLAPDPTPGFTFDITGAVGMAEELAKKKEEYLSSVGKDSLLLRKEIKMEESKIRQKLRKQNDELGSIDYRVHFASVFGNNGGFDIVLANPPYVRHEMIKDIKPKLKSRYVSYSGTADLLVYFFERGIQLCRSGGVISYITSNKYLKSKYGAKLRSFLKENIEIQTIIDFGDAPVFENAIAYPSILIGRKLKPQRNNLISTLSWGDSDSINELVDITETKMSDFPQYELTEELWSFDSEVERKIIKKMKLVGRSLGELIDGKFYRGILTGLNEAFVLNLDQRNKLIDEDPSCKGSIKPLKRGKSLKKWSSEESGEYLIVIPSSGNFRHPWTGKSDERAEKIFADSLPAIYNHLLPFRNKLIERYDKGQYYWELRNCTYFEQFERQKIVFPDIAISPKFSIDKEENYLVNTSYMIPTGEVWLAGVLNSSASHWFMKKISPSIRGNYLRFIAQNVSQIPIPPISSDLKSQLSTMIWELKAEDENSLNEIQENVDNFIFNAFNLTNDERRIINEGTR